MIDGDYDTMLSLKREQVEGFFETKPINFNPMVQMPRSQDLIPIYLHCSTILAWKSKTIKQKMAEHGCCAYGADSKVGYYTFDSFANVDIDNVRDELDACDEMKTHKELLKLKLVGILAHPLSESFLHVKWQLTKKIFLLNMLLYSIFLISLGLRYSETSKFLTEPPKVTA